MDGPPMPLLLALGMESERAKALFIRSVAFSSKLAFPGTHHHELSIWIREPLLHNGFHFAGFQPAASTGYQRPVQSLVRFG